MKCEYEENLKLLGQCADIYFRMLEIGFTEDLTKELYGLIIDIRNDLARLKSKEKSFIVRKTCCVVPKEEESRKRWVTIDGRHVDIGGDGDSDSGGGKPPVDSDGKEYNRPRLWLPPNEYAHVMSTISTYYKSKFKGKSMCMIELEFDDKWANYYFEIHGFNEYNIFDKEET